MPLRSDPAGGSAGPDDPGSSGRRPSALPTAVKVVLAALGVAALLVSLVAAPSVDQAASERVAVGETEPVRITGPDGTTVEALARIDTGAARSSIDEEIAEELGLDLDEAETVTVVSALGREERPVVDVAVQLGGTAQASLVSVNDRERLSTPVLIGRTDLEAFQVLVGQSLLTTPGEPRAPSAVSAALLQVPVYGPDALLALVPLSAVVMVALRQVVGLSTLGTFSPVLLALAYVQSGLRLGLALTVLVLAAGLLAQPLLRRFRLPRVARLGVLVSLVATTLLGLTALLDVTTAGQAWGAALPIVVSAVIVERLWEAWDVEGATTALQDGAVTLAVAALVTLLLLSPPVRVLAEAVPLRLALVSLVWAWLIGTYRGLRLSELARFRAAAAGRVAVPA